MDMQRMCLRLRWHCVEVSSLAVKCASNSVRAFLKETKTDYNRQNCVCAMSSITTSISKHNLRWYWTMCVINSLNSSIFHIKYSHF